MFYVRDSLRRNGSVGFHKAILRMSLEPYGFQMWLSKLSACALLLLQSTMQALYNDARQIPADSTVERMW